MENLFLLWIKPQNIGFFKPCFEGPIMWNTAYPWFFISVHCNSRKPNVGKIQNFVDTFLTLKGVQTYMYKCNWRITWLEKKWALNLRAVQTTTFHIPFSILSWLGHSKLINSSLDSLAAYIIGSKFFITLLAPFFHF